MSREAIAGEFRKVTETYMQIVDIPKAWKGSPGVNWTKFWQACERAVGMDASLRRDGFTGCIYGEGKSCPAIAPANCAGCVDLSHSTN